MEEGNYLKKELYELMQNNNSIFEFIQDGSLDGLWYWDLQRPENEWMNKKFWDVLGYDYKEKKHLSSQWQDIINQDDLKTSIENLNKHIEDSSYPYDQVVRYRHKKGHTVWIRCRGLAIKDKNGKAIRMLGSHSDITKEKTAQKELEDKSEALKAILDSSLDGIMALENITDKSGEIVDFRFIMVNKEACKIVKFKEKEILGRSLYELMPGNFERLECLDGNSLFDKYKEVVLTKKANALEFYFDFDGIKEWFSNKVVKYKNGFVCTFAIITEQKRFQNELEQIVEQKMQEQRKQEQLLIQQSKMASMGEMLGAIAHNWRQPLNSLSLLVASLNLRVQSDIASKEYINSWQYRVNKQIKFMSQTIESFKNFYKSSEKIKTFSLNDSINTLVSLFKPQFKTLDIEVVIDIDSDIFIESLENQLQQALVNIVTNSKDIIEQKGIKKGVITICAISNKNHIMLTIYDNAGGINNKDVLSRVFEPYFTTKQTGTGIGLYMTKTLIERNLKGEINVKNQKNGLAFFIKLPKNIDTF
ncbi:MAG: PAS domain-containing sensor histidine kinase [Campylobacterota bacterium]